MLAFDYRHFGTSGGEPRQLLDINKQLEDWRSALSFVRTQKDVVQSKIVIWGHHLVVGMFLLLLQMIIQL